VALGDRSLDRVAVALGDESVEPMVGQADRDDARERRLTLRADAGLEALDAPGADEGERAAHDEHADALAVARDRPSAEVEPDRTGGRHDEAVAGARLLRHRVGRAERARGYEQVAAAARHGLAADVVAAAVHRGRAPGREHQPGGHQQPESPAPRAAETSGESSPHDRAASLHECGPPTVALARKAARAVRPAM